MNRERAKERLADYLRNRYVGTPTCDETVLARSIIDAIADELEAEAAQPAELLTDAAGMRAALRRPSNCPVCLSAEDPDSGLCVNNCYHNRRADYVRAVAEERATLRRFVVQAADVAEPWAPDPKGRKGYDY